LYKLQSYVICEFAQNAISCFVCFCNVRYADSGTAGKNKITGFRKELGDLAGSVKKMFISVLAYEFDLPHINPDYPRSGYLYFFTIHYSLLPNRQDSKERSEK